MRFEFDVICIYSTCRLGTAKCEAIYELTSQARITLRTSSVCTLYISLRPPSYWIIRSQFLLHRKYLLCLSRTHILFFISLNFPMTSIGSVSPVAFCTAGSWWKSVSNRYDLSCQRAWKACLQPHESIVFLVLC